MTNPDLDTFLRRLRQLGQALDRDVGEARTIAVAGKALQEEIASRRANITRLERVGAALSTVGEARQETLQARIETLVTQGLQTIFGDELTFHVIAAIERNTPTISFEVRSRIGDQVVATDVMDARGGGLAAIVGFLLRLVVLLLSKGKGETVLVQDETFSFVSAEYRPKLAAFLRQLADKTGVQVLLVTHSDEFAAEADVRYRFQLVGGATKVTAF